MRTGINRADGLRRKLRSRPMCIAIPHTPRDRSIRPREFFEYLQPIGKREVKAAIRGRKKDAKEPLPRQVPREIFG
jgi:hypothetical protein